jgi:hypothetical protein
VLAAFADELQLDIRQPDMVRPAIGGRRAKDNGEAIWKPGRNDNQSIIGALRRMPGCPLKNSSSPLSIPALPTIRRLLGGPGIILHPDRTRGISCIANGAHHVGATRARARDGPLWIVWEVSRSRDARIPRLLASSFVFQWDQLR